MAFKGRAPAHGAITYLSGIHINSRKTLLVFQTGSVSCPPSASYLATSWASWAKQGGKALKVIAKVCNKCQHVQACLPKVLVDHVYSLCKTDDAQDGSTCPRHVLLPLMLQTRQYS